MKEAVNIFDGVEKPTLLLDRSKAIRNIERMVVKAQKSGVRLRPHFKTHQSSAVGEWFRARGIDAITVSSVDMAAYFADAGWQDITIAFPANPLQINGINDLASRVRLGLLLESVETMRRLSQGLQSDVAVWLKIDAGYHRTGIPWDDRSRVMSVATAVHEAPLMRLQGILTHAGDTYGARSSADVVAIYDRVFKRLKELQSTLQLTGLPAAISVGDTPGCSLVDSFEGVDEVRPGNFVFYDLMQLQIGACSFEDVAVAVACPVVARHPSRGQIILYGGAIHLSKERLVEPDGRISFGGVALPEANGWGPLVERASVISVSQEHGIVQADRALIERVDVGDVLVVIPIHSCLTANLFHRYHVLDGEQLEIAQLL